ncbi:MAG: hypothetical protein RBT63_05725, partial [Bdellovibrionales bacterium]|nr:hypothetical protein [Bdellovibrionales bacterium]
AEDVVSSLRHCLEQGGRIFLCGCGATGRLALVLESIWRETRSPHFDSERIIAFTAGGDYALVRSLGIFEDQPKLGAQHLLDLGFKNGDLLVAITEGGETPFVLGALEQATKTSAMKSWLFFCNPSDVLKELVQRSREAIENPGVLAHSLEVEPMALTGSTRLQASSVLMAFVGACLQEVSTKKKYAWIVSEILDGIDHLQADLLRPLIEAESAVHQASGYTLHQSQTAAIAVLTDTTERAPTFSLVPFENSAEQESPQLSRTYLEIPDAQNSEAAWSALLKRRPRPFQVRNGFQAPAIDEAALLGFDFSRGVYERRLSSGAETDLTLRVEFVQNEIHFDILPATHPEERFELIFPSSADLLVRQCLLKYVLNLQSTLMMGRIGRFHGNLMTYVRPTNNKLIDRTLRTLRILAAQSPDTHLRSLARTPDDEVFLNALFVASLSISSDEAVALKALDLLSQTR